MMDVRALQPQVTQRVMGLAVVKELRQGSLHRNQYIAYLSDIYCYAKHSSVVIGMAGVRMVHTHPALSKYLMGHANEELGHDVWAAADLGDLGLSKAEIDQIQPSSACARMIGLEYYYAAHDNPVGLFGWMFVLESLGGEVGGSIASAIDKTLELHGKGTYFLRGHGEADTHHSEDLCEVISKHVKADCDITAFRTMFHESLDLICAILDHAHRRGER